MTGSFVLEVNFAGDGVTFVDITDHLVSLQCSRGRDYASQLTGRSVAGALQAELMNEDGRFSSYNAAGAYYGNLLPGRKVRFKSTAPTAATLWTGFLSGPPQPTVGAKTIPRATLNAVGALAILGNPNTKINPAALTNVNTDDVIDAILDAAGWPAGARNLDVGVVPIARWFVSDAAGALDKLQEMEETEFGFLYEDLAWGIGFENRYHRIGNSAVSQATFSDALAAALGYTAINQDDPLREIFNDITAQIPSYSLATLAVLWTFSDVPFYMAPGESKTVIATFTSVYVDAWSTPVSGTDILHDANVADGDIGISVTKTATAMFITMTNNHASAGTYISQVQAQGTAVVSGDPYQVSSEDTTSQANYGLRSYPLPSPWYSNAAYAQAACDYFVDRQKAPRPIVTIEIVSGQSSTYFAQGAARTLSERITVVATARAKLGLSGDVYIEAIHHQVSSRSLLRTTWDLSPADAVGRYFTLDVSQLDTADPLAF